MKIEDRGWNRAAITKSFYPRSSILDPLERALVDRARAADLGRLVGVQLLAKLLVGRAVPSRLHATFLHLAKIDTVGRGDHTARHRVTIVADIAAAPRPVAALDAGGAGRVRARARARQAQVDAKLVG